ncbi:MAG: TIGR04053 family radical SAM/SPASM domain-containing protein [Myxococcota bacterium]|nr:TIGR04053 family radical SAM/SPASM domain-containing protein [Myxococcota bacterium]MDW8363822.1 TIGR04053 family radical SAM/SPASM domain-containing protein [Myxococcales bacterium]
METSETPASDAQGGAVGHPMFEHAPFLVFWEMTRACELVCRHCRACAMPWRDPLELDGAEGRRLLEQIRAMGTPLCVLTGGDPAMRPDLVDLVEHGTRVGLRMALTPSATARVTRELLERLRDAGLDRLALSVDGVHAASHDGLRGVDGSYVRTRALLEAARGLGLRLQVNTTLHAGNAHELEALGESLIPLGIELWSVFLIVPTGRARPEDVPSPQAVEALLERLAELAARLPFEVKTTAAPMYRRVLLTRRERLRRGLPRTHASGLGRAPPGINDGRGVLFVSHRGEVMPSGLLPIACGDVRREPIERIYRRAPLLVRLRDPDALRGKCGACEYRKLCGGSRARAYAVHGDPLGPDPACAYVPTGWAGERVATPSGA